MPDETSPDNSPTPPLSPLKSPQNSDQVPETSSEIGQSPPKTDKPKKKRLTLQERLALATKSKELANKSKKEAEEKQLQSANDISSTGDQSHPNPDLKSIDPHEKTKGPDTQHSPLSSDTSANSDVLAENKQLKAEIAKLKKLTISSELKKKDELIQQLMDEGEQLSIKELKLNDTIKKLRATNIDLEQVISEFNTKNEQSVGIISEIDQVMKKAKIKSYDDLTSVINEYNRWKQQSLPDKLDQTQNQLNEEIKQKNENNKQINDLKIQLDLLKENHKIELDNKQEVISSLRQEIKTMKLVNAQEVVRLENKVEALILENDTTPKSSSDSQDYEKLFKNYSNLQNEVLNSRSNWELIEINLNSKISELSQKAESLKKDKLNLIIDNKDLKQKINQINSQVQDLEAEKVNLQAKLTQSNEEKDSIKLELDSMSSKLEKINSIYNNEKSALITKIDNLESELTKEQSIVPQSLTPLEPPAFDTSIYNSNNVSSHSLASLDFDDTSNYHSSNIQSQPGSFQLINKMSSSIRNLKVELNSLKDENDQLMEEKDNLELKLLNMSKQVDKVDFLQQKIASLETEIEEKTKKEDNLLEILGEKEERVEELINDVQDLKELCKLQVQQMIELQENK